MIGMLVWVILVLLIAFAILDLKLKQIPSIFLTAGLFIVLFLRFNNLYLGLLSLVIAWLLLEADFFGGLADVKVMGIIGFMLSSLNYFPLYLISIGLIGIAWKTYILWKHPKDKDCAFVPVLTICYIILLIIGGVS